MLCRCAEMQRRECKAEKWWLLQTVDPRTGGLRARVLHYMYLTPETTSCCFTEFPIFFYQKPSKFKQKLYPFPDPFSQLSYLFTSIIVKFIVWHFVWISFSWKIWIIIGRIVFVIRLLFLHIMLTFVHVFVRISNHIKNNCTWKYWFWYKYSENHCILVNFQLINQS